MSHVTHVMSHVTHDMSHVIHVTCSRHDWHGSLTWLITCYMCSSCILHTFDGSCHTYEWVMSHIWMSHVTHLMSRVTHVMSHVIRNEHITCVTWLIAYYMSLLSCITIHCIDVDECCSPILSHIGWESRSCHTFDESCHTCNEPCHTWRACCMSLLPCALRGACLNKDESCYRVMSQIRHSCHKYDPHVTNTTLISHVWQVMSRHIMSRAWRGSEGRRSHGTWYQWAVEIDGNVAVVGLHDSHVWPCKARQRVVAAMSHVTHVSSHLWVMSHVWPVMSCAAMSHVTHVASYWWVMSHVWRVMSHVTRITSLVMSHTWGVMLWGTSHIHVCMLCVMCYV